jgi:hypothetical protein
LVVDAPPVVEEALGALLTESEHAVQLLNRIAPDPTLDPGHDRLAVASLALQLNTERVHNESGLVVRVDVTRDGRGRPLHDTWCVVGFGDNTFECLL